MRANPEVVDQLGIAKLYAGGFTAVYRCGDGSTGSKNFDFQPNVEQVLYTKQGWETMASIKPLALFLKDCFYDTDISLTWKELGEPDDSKLFNA